MRRPDGSPALDRRGRLKTDKTILIADGTGQPVTPGEPVSGVDEATVAWAVAATRRRWSTVQDYLGTSARENAYNLVRAGVIALTCPVSADLTLGTPTSWAATPPWRDWHAARAHATERQAATWTKRAAAAADQIGTVDPGLATALRTRAGSDALLPVLVYAAEDLAAGVSHDGPRAFSQAHFGHTKERDDVPKILAAAGATSDTIEALGLRRSPYLGLGGAIALNGPGDQVELARFAGPILFRADDRALRPNLPAPAPLVLIENLQAAEAVCDHHPEAAVVWFAGQPSDVTLTHIAALAEQASRVVLAADADLGGASIVARVLAALPEPEGVDVIDVGMLAHPERKPFASAAREALSALAGTSGQGGAFAAAVLERGYPVEQEASIRAAVEASLNRTSGRPLRPVVDDAKRP